MSFIRNTLLCIVLTLLFSSCATQKKEEAVFKLPEIPKYPETQIKISENESPLCVVGYVASGSFREDESLTLLRKRLKTLIPAEKAELAETNKKIAILEKRENEINEMRQIAKAVEGEMRSCGYNIIEPYVPAKSLTGEYIKKMIDTNFAYCNVNAVNAANNANPRQGEYTLASVFSDIEDNIVINDYKFGYKDRIKADRLITINFLEKKEAGDSNNYIFDIKCRIDVVNAKDSGKIGSVEVWGRYLSGVARKSGNSSKSTGNPFVQARKDMTKNPGIRPIDRNIVNQIMDEKSIAFVEAGRDMGRNLLTIPEFMELVTGKKQ